MTPSAYIQLEVNDSRQTRSGISPLHYPSNQGTKVTIHLLKDNAYLTLLSTASVLWLVRPTSGLARDYDTVNATSPIQLSSQGCVDQVGVIYSGNYFCSPSDTVFTTVQV